MRTHSTHVSDEQLDRYRRRVAEPAELLAVDEHLASCDRCYALVRADANVTLPAADSHAAVDDHLEYEELERYVDGSATEVERELVAGHVELCKRCRMELHDLEGVRDSMKVRPIRRRPLWSWAAAALLAMVLVTAWLLFGTREPAKRVEPQLATTTVSEPAQAVLPKVELEKPAVLDSLIRGEGVLRGGASPAFALEEPVGTVVREERPRFRWSAARNATSYDVAVVDTERGNLAASGSTSSTRWQPTRSLPRGRTYTWQVTAHAEETTIVAPGPSGAEALFHVAENEEPLPGKAFDRGVALARMGVLDEAERELERAASEGEPRAAAVLDEVRSWRERRGSAGQ
ncbi:MAG TPA: hypothetical protein VGF48_17105 [Thermoanaerobaculia bacterium]|jgi:hypothetical protein